MYVRRQRSITMTDYGTYEREYDLDYYMEACERAREYAEHYMEDNYYEDLDDEM
jgi:hypothetical protein